MHILLLMSLVHAVLADIEKAKADGHITVGEAIDIAAEAAHRAAATFRVENHILFSADHPTATDTALQRHRRNAAERSLRSSGLPPTPTATVKDDG